MSECHQQAQQQSKDGATRFVVYVPDQGPDVFTAAQMAMYRGFVFPEAAYLDGKKVAA